jgi:predicted nucleotidyltransferase
MMGTPATENQFMTTQNVLSRKLQDDAVLLRFRTVVAATYGPRIERVVLFGSRARGDAEAESDYDIAVFIKDAGTFTDESARLAAIGTDILFDTGAVISATPFPAGACHERTGFMHELRKDGLIL